jgi:hypothetical protein
MARASESTGQSDFKIKGKRRRLLVLRRCISLLIWVGFLGSAIVVAPNVYARAQEKPPAQPKPIAQEKKPVEVKPPAPEKSNVQSGQVTAEQVAETAIYWNGGREGMAQVRKTGIERGRLTRAVADGKFEEATYERRIIRGDNTEKDRIRFDLKMPTAEYALVLAGGQVWGIINDAIFTPRQETTHDFLSWQRHGIDTLLRYKEDGSTLNMIGKEKQKGLDLWVLDVTDKEQRRTRYYVSAKSARILWLEYEERPDSGGDPVKFQRKFHDYHRAQGMLIPYRTVLFKDGTQVEESNVMTVTFGPRIDDALFINPTAPSPTTASKP